MLFQKVFNSEFSMIIFYSKNDKNKSVDSSFETMAFTLQQIKK